MLQYPVTLKKPNKANQWEASHFAHMSYAGQPHFAQTEELRGTTPLRSNRRATRGKQTIKHFAKYLSGVGKRLAKLRADREIKKLKNREADS